MHSNARSICWAFDFDGTLSPLEKLPHQALMTDQTRSLLKDLSLLAPVIILSGRGLLDLKKKIGLNRSILVGNHGLEISSAWIKALKAQNECRGWKRALMSALQKELFLNKIFLEDKKYSLSVHFLEPLTSREKLRLRSIFSWLHPEPKMISGKNVMNLISKSSLNKGQALNFLMDQHGYRKSFFVGDDVTDEDVFRIKNNSIFSVRVGYSKNSHARYFLRSQNEVDRLLSDIQNFLLKLQAT
ncbi:MAG: trehalose-phosphatase [Deltaproteobacteria bacterium]|nr:MAG: trehalose-phosphatase [Deltaproteobacteria bacterium]